jgi:arginine decarboxylase
MEEISRQGVRQLPRHNLREISGFGVEAVYLDLNGSLKDAMDTGREVVSASFIIPYPPGFPILAPGQVVSQEILAFMRALDVNEIHGYRADLGLRVFTPEALAKCVSLKLPVAAE